MQQMWNSEEHLAVAVSGGVDSMVLVDKVRRQHSYASLTLLHVNHGLRTQSEQEQQMITTYAATYGIPLLVKRLSKRDFDLSKSIQAQARHTRYQFFDSMMEHHAIDVLLTAHHQDDQLETIMFRLLTGRFKMEPLHIKSSTERRYRIIRPLIDESKTALYEYAALNSVPFMEDESNQSLKYKRNQIRHQVMPVVQDVFPQAGNHLLDLGRWHEDVLELLDSNVDQLDKEVVAGKLSITKFNAAPAIVRRHFLLRRSINQTALAADYLDEIIRVLAEAKRNVSYPLGDCTLEYAYGYLYFRTAERNDTIVSITSPGRYLFNDYVIHCDEIICPLTVRLPAIHDKIELKERSLKLNRLFINEKIPMWERKRMPIIEAEGKIIAAGPYRHTKHPMNQIIKMTPIKENENA